MFNSREYEYADITLVLGGKDITGIRGLAYSAEQAKEAIYGKGSEPVSIQKGNRSYSGTLTLLQSELETLILNSKDASILSLQLDAVVCYGNPGNGDVMITDVLQGVQFTKEPKGLKQGDKFMEIALPFIFLRKKNQTR